MLPPSLPLSLTLAALALCSCSKRSDALERQYNMMKQSHASMSELCKKNKEVADALLAEENAEKYKMRSVEADLDCAEADMNLQR
jgi:hypothetical protein